MPFTMEMLVQSSATSCEISGRQSSTGAGYSLSTSAYHCRSSFH